MTLTSRELVGSTTGAVPASRRTAGRAVAGGRGGDPVTISRDSSRAALGSSMR
jgi:hypothetical protein